MKSTKGTISEALAQVAAYNKEQRPSVEAEVETLDERATDSYGNPVLTDSDKNKVSILRHKIKVAEEEIGKLRYQIHQIKKTAGVDQ